ncbi:hypothetical protein AB0941_41580 [Streptomyces sp. NPDC013433]|uniref:hypothetical protein n=1 Tax=Streptomyces sp. NPDC013433 TaxID=3155604 RepID=UPI0034514368
MRGRARGEYEWALEVVGRLQVPEQASLDEVIALVARQVGRPLAVVPIEAPVTNGAGDPLPCTAVAVAVNIVQLRVGRFDGAKLLGEVAPATMARVDAALRAVQDL